MTESHALLISRLIEQGLVNDPSDRDDLGAVVDALLDFAAPRGVKMYGFITTGGGTTAVSQHGQVAMFHGHYKHYFISMHWF